MHDAFSSQKTFANVLETHHQTYQFCKYFSFGNKVTFLAYLIAECRQISVQDELEEHDLESAIGYIPLRFTKKNCLM
jgi:hypothetical protein